MSTVTIVGIVAGSALIVTAIIVFLSKKEFQTGGVMVTVVGLVLIGMSQWNSIKLTVGEATLEAIREELNSTKDATNEVAEQVEQAAKAVETTRMQLLSLNDQLKTSRVLPDSVTVSIQEKLSSAPQVDLTKLGLLRKNLSKP